LAASLAQHPINERRKKMISIHKSAGVLAALLLAPSAWAALLTFESTGPDAAAITPTRDAFRSTVGGGEHRRGQRFLRRPAPRDQLGRCT
jgi:hypothetical protein